MKIVERLSDVRTEKNARGCVVAVGTFDGVHIGHQTLISRAVSLAREAGASAVVLTFQNHPLSVLAPERVPSALSSPGERRQVFESLGIDLVVEERFTKELASISAEDFLACLVEALAPRAVVVGENFSFGAGGRGTPDFLLAWDEAAGVRVEKVPLLLRAGKTVSSTRIRALLSAGDVRFAGELLGRPFSLSGLVVHGDERGRTLGFPTANILPSPGEACPAKGAYAVRATLGDGSEHCGVANVGDNPTFGGVEPRVETHILDFSGDLYGAPMTVRFVERLRAEQKFPSPEALVEQIRRDEQSAREIFSSIKIESDACR
ncbi:MAG: bifunctional riboflavin kinase/FAD synthetase [Schwartzia sp.]|nr:bifunctional riboflavin kinase/FAD synthetase [Schwartzia sp. (in: firmicutes)]